MVVRVTGPMTMFFLILVLAYQVVHTLLFWTGHTDKNSTRQYNII
jgi:hypothetical protein